MIYVYRCHKCQEVFEKEQSIKDARLVSCEKCGGTLSRVPQVVGVSFKGPGFYKTDYSGKN